MWQKLIQTGEEDAKSRVREFALEVGVISILEVLGDFVGRFGNSLVGIAFRAGGCSSADGDVPSAEFGGGVDDASSEMIRPKRR